MKNEKKETNKIESSNKNANRKKALWRHEFRTSKWFLVMGCILALLGLLYVFIDTQTYSVYFYLDSNMRSMIVDGVVNVLTFASIGLLIGIPLMTALQYSEQKIKNTGEFIHSLPVSKERLLGTKVMIGVLCITIPSVIYLIGSIVIWNYRIDEARIQYLTSPYYKMLLANDTVQNIVANVLIFWLMALALYAISLVVQTIIKPCFVAMVVTLGVAWMPHYLLSMIGNIGYVNGYSMAQLDEVTNYFWLWCGGAQAHVSSVDMSERNAIALRVFDNPIVTVICYLLIIAVSAVLVWMYHGRQQLEDSKHFIISRPMNYFFKVCTSICISIGLLGIQSGRNSNILFLVLMFAFLSVFVYWLLDRAIKRYE